jgi:hypothetical protein
MQVGSHTFPHSEKIEKLVSSVLNAVSLWLSLSVSGFHLIKVRKPKPVLLLLLPIAGYILNVSLLFGPNLIVHNLKYHQLLVSPAPPRPEF